ncbi:MAG: glutamylcysteine synthetase [Oscillospiraceae bacterium]
MENKLLEQALYNKYIQPTKKQRDKKIGIEIEMPVVNLNKQAVEQASVLEMADDFRRHFNFRAVSKDFFGNVNSMADPITGDDLSFDCSYNNLELSMGIGENLFEIKSRFENYYLYINKYLKKFNYTLTGMGINPYYNINKPLPIANERYRMLWHFLHTYKENKGVGSDTVFYDHPDFATFCSASQVQIDVDYDELIDVINTFGKLEPYNIFLFANSYMPEYPDTACARNMFWEHSMQGYNPHNLGVFEYELKDVNDLVDYIKTQSIYCTMRDGKYIDFTPIPVESFFNMQTVKGKYFDSSEGIYKETEFSPSLEEDLPYFRTFKFEDLTFRGTVEFRSSCCQPVSESMTVAAFRIGLMHNLEKIKKLMADDNVLYSHGYTAGELAKMLSKLELPQFVNKDKLRAMLTEILDIASEGLIKRGKNEQSLLKPLYTRAEKLTNPALEMIRGIEKGRTLEDYILEYAKFR